jgi:hypothetical protein
MSLLDLRISWRVSVVVAVLCAWAHPAARAQLPFQPFGRLVNISTRAHVGSGNNALIAGFVIRGTAPKKLVIRGIGPSLKGAGISDPLEHPIIELHDSAGAVMAVNDGWKASQEQEIAASGLAPADDREAAIIRSLNPGAYTAVLRGSGDTTGTGLVEVYDADTESASVLVNVSTRGFVAENSSPMIGGVIIADEGTPMNQIVARALGPSLKQAGVEKPLADPTLEVRDRGTRLVASNDDCDEAEHADVLEENSLMPNDGGESAIASVVAPGAYTAIVRGANGASGTALVEFYHLR